MSKQEYTALMIARLIAGAFLVYTFSFWPACVIIFFVLVME